MASGKEYIGKESEEKESAKERRNEKPSQEHHMSEKMNKPKTPMSPKMDHKSVEHSPMPAHKMTDHPLKHLEKFKYKKK